MDISSLSDVNSILSEKTIVETQIAHASILPYPGTSFGSIHTVLLNYQDVLKQKWFGRLPYRKYFGVHLSVSNRNWCKIYFYSAWSIYPIWNGW